MSEPQRNARADVVVVGAGPAGLTAALALRSLGLRPIILERRRTDDPRAGSRAAYVHGESLRHLERISPGLGGGIAEAGTMWTTKRTLWRGHEVYCQTYAPQSPAIGLPSFTSLPQTRTEDLMLEACARAGIEICHGVDVSSLRVEADRVSLTDADGKTWTAPYVIGADGSRSAVRRAIGATLEGPRTDHTFVVVDIEEDPAHPRPRERIFHYDAPRVGGRNLLLVPFAGGWRVDLNLRAGDDAEWWTSPEGLHSWIPNALGPGYEERVSWVSRYTFAQQTASHLTDPGRRVLLCGEAAHLFAPFGARGMNSSVPDGIAAAAAVHEGLRHGPSSAEAHAAVDRFARERLSAARYNRDCASEALTHMTGATLPVRLRRHVASWGARLGRRHGKWLDSAPYGPTVAARARPGSSY